MDNALYDQLIGQLQTGLIVSFGYAAVHYIFRRVIGGG